MKGRRVLVTGGTGLVGSNLVKRLVLEGAEVTATFFRGGGPLKECSSVRWLYADLTKFDHCLEAVERVQDVFLCAAQTHGAATMQKKPTALVHPNLVMNANMIEACQSRRVERVAFVSSSTVYQESDRPLREEDLDLNQDPYPVYLGVGWMKRYTEQLARFYFRTSGLPVAIIRPTNIYGPGDKFKDEATSHVIPALVRRALEHERPYKVWGSPSVLRDFIYVEDAIDVLLWAIDHHATADPVNVATGRLVSMRETAEFVLKACDHDAAPVFDLEAPETIPRRELDCHKLKALGGPLPRTLLETGLGNTVEWMRAQGVGRG